MSVDITDLNQTISLVLALGRKQRLVALARLPHLVGTPACASKPKGWTVTGPSRKPAQDTADQHSSARASRSRLDSLGNLEYLPAYNVQFRQRDRQTDEEVLPLSGYRTLIDEYEYRADQRRWLRGAGFVCSL